MQKKWHNILITYNKNLNKKYVSGYVHWEFFEEMFKYLQGKKADFDMQLPQQTSNAPQAPHSANGQNPNPGIPQQPLQLQPTPVSLKPGTPQMQVQLPPQTAAKDSQPYITPVDQVLLQAQMNLDSKSNDEFDEDSNSMSEVVRQPKMEYDGDQVAEAERTNDSSQHLEVNGKLYDLARPWARTKLLASPMTSGGRTTLKKTGSGAEKIELQRSLQREQVQIQNVTGAAGAD